MDPEQEIEGLLDSNKILPNQERILQKGRWIWVALPCIFLLGMAAGWGLSTHLQGIPYTFDTSRCPKKTTVTCKLTFQTAISAAQTLAKPIHRKSTIPAGPGNFSDPFRRPPSKELDEAWDSLYTNSLLLITESDLHRMGKNPKEHAHLPPSLNYGSKKYLAKFDHIHTIHCLNLIRKWVHSDHYFPHGKPKTIGFVHVDHCIAALLDNLLCHVDYGMFTYQWVEGEPFPQADFGVDRQCRDYGALLDFARARRVDDDLLVRYLPRPEDAVVFPQDVVIENFTREWERGHPGQTTREEMFAENGEKYEDGVRKWRETGKIPLIEVGEREP